eukprot:COSAG01_NODE_2056_length_8537_cov_4.215607_5_plen_249_part_00
MGTPHVVDLGKELEFSLQANGGGDSTPRVYMVGDGATEAIDPYASQTWMQGSETYIARTKVTPTVSVMDDPSQWEFAKGSSGQWVDNVSDARPIWSWPNRTGSTTITYVSPISKFIMVVDAPGPKPQTPGQSMGGPFDTYFLEADQITGPYRLITYMPAFGPAAYFSNVPSKFVGNVSTDDHGQKVLECFLSYSQWGQLPGNCLVYLPVGRLQMLLRFAADAGKPTGRTDPPGSTYKWNMLPIRLVLQ